MIVNMKPVLFLCILLLASSCMKEVDLEHLRPAPKLVLNSVVSNGDILKASLSRTWFYTDKRPNLLLEARMSLYINDHFKEEMTLNMDANDYYSYGNYVSSYIPVSGDKVRIEVEKEGFNRVVAEEIVPFKPDLISLKAESFIRNDYNSQDTQSRYKITFRDEPSASNCYLIMVYRGYPYYEYEDYEKPPVYKGRYTWHSESIDYSSDPVFDNKISILDRVMGNDWLSGNGGRPFSDELFNGKEYTMTLESNIWYSHNPIFPQPEEYLPDSVRVYLYTITEPYYKYLSALTSLYDGSLNNDLADIGLAEPVRVFCNIDGGLGILGAACVDSLTVAIPKAN